MPALYTNCEIWSRAYHLLIVKLTWLVPIWMMLYLILLHYNLAPSTKKLKSKGVSYLDTNMHKCVLNSIFETKETLVATSSSKTTNGGEELINYCIVHYQISKANSIGYWTCSKTLLYDLNLLDMNLQKSEAEMVKIALLDSFRFWTTYPARAYNYYSNAPPPYSFRHDCSTQFLLTRQKPLGSENCNFITLNFF